jgi:phosphatidylserine decarboxylase
MNIPIDKDSHSTILISWLVCAAIIALLWLFVKPLWITVPLTVALVVFMAFITWFFRVPERTIPEGDNIVTSVCDGKVVGIQKAYEGEFLQRECIQISIFMSIYSVHCNYWPVSGDINYYQYHPGKYLVAFHPKSSEKNEHSSTCIRRADGKEVFFKQIAGFVARRVVNYAGSRNATVAERGKQCGVILFGSRIDLFLPLDADVKVKVGDKLKAVETIVAEL